MPQPRRHGPWTIQSTQEIYRDPWLRLVRDEVTRPDGQPGTYSVVHLLSGVCVVAMDAEEHVYLTEEFHYAVGRVTLEGVSGGIEDGETALSTAHRELREELGIEAARWDDMGSVDPFTGSIRSPTRLFLARELSIGTAEPEGTEQIRKVRLRLDDAHQAVLDSRITHSPSCVLIMKTWHQLRQSG